MAGKWNSFPNYKYFKYKGVMFSEPVLEEVWDFKNLTKNCNSNTLCKRTCFIWECWSTWVYFLSRKGNQLVFLALRLIMVLSSFKLNQQESFQRRCWNEFVCKCLKQPLRGNFLIWKQFTNNYISNAFWETV